MRTVSVVALEIGIAVLAVFCFWLFYQYINGCDSL
jgi:hypothetical protein